MGNFTFLGPVQNRINKEAVDGLLYAGAGARMNTKRFFRVLHSGDIPDLELTLTNGVAQLLPVECVEVDVKEQGWSGGQRQNYYGTVAERKMAKRTWFGAGGKLEKWKQKWVEEFFFMADPLFLRILRKKAREVFDEKVGWMEAEKARFGGDLEDLKRNFFGGELGRLVNGGLAKAIVTESIRVYMEERELALGDALGNDDCTRLVCQFAETKLLGQDFQITHYLSGLMSLFPKKVQKIVRSKAEQMKAEADRVWKDLFVSRAADAVVEAWTLGGEVEGKIQVTEMLGFRDVSLKEWPRVFGTDSDEWSSSYCEALVKELEEKRGFHTAALLWEMLSNTLWLHLVNIGEI